MRRLLTLAVLAWPVLCPGLARAAEIPPRNVEILPLDQIRPGMTGVGRTVFEGVRIEEFQVRILGVLENALGPKHSVILAQLEGGPLAKTGVIAGMSGSPVFIDGKLVGAVAYAFPFGKEPIAGITPIGDMIEATRVETPRAASARFVPTRGPGLGSPLDREEVAAAFRRPLQTIIPGLLHGASVPGSMAGATMTQLALPLVFSGFDPGTFDWARGIFSGLGFAPMLGASAASPGTLTAPALAPGSAVGVSLIEGDLDLSVTGTVTHIDGDRVYAFGHPFYNLGPTQFPMKKAYIYSVFPSLQQSWKIASSLDVVGTVDQDRTTAVAGRIGKAPRMIPVEVKLSTSRGTERKFSFRLVEDELFSPLLTYVSLLSVLQANERAFGTSTIRVDGRLTLSDRREIRVEDLFTAGQPSAQAAALVAAPLAFVMTNEFQKVTVERLDLNVTSYETTQSASIQRAWIERAGPIRAGSSVSVKVLLRTFRGDSVTETIPMAVPASAPAGTYSLLVADAAALTAVEQREMRQPFIPKDLDQLVRAINGLRKSSHLYARLVRPADGAIVSGEYLPSLPGSVLSVLGAAEQGTSVVPIRSAAVWDFELPTAYAVAGTRTISLNIVR
jgi:SpoIVB peptidase S55